ncbi:hypothetical protein [Pseudoramibacter alactolyticus]
MAAMVKHSDKFSLFQQRRHGGRQIWHANSCRNIFYQQIVFVQSVFAGFVFDETAVRIQPYR